MKNMRPTKVHLLRNTFILLSLFGLCMIPFALGQRIQHDQSDDISTKSSDAEDPMLGGWRSAPQEEPVPEQPASCTFNGTLGTAPSGGTTGTLATRLYRPGTPTSTCAGVTWPGNTGTGSFIYNVHYITNSGASPLCMTATLHVVTQGTSTVNMQLSAFVSPFAAANVT